jgi:transcriptional regulator with XRE-family HTH domain
MDIKKVFGGNLRRARLEKGLTQEAMEGLTGFDRSYIGGLERGVRNPSLTAFAAIADALEIDPAQLLQGYKSDK